MFFCNFHLFRLIIWHRNCDPLTLPLASSRHCRSRVRQLSPMGEKQTTQPTCCAAYHGMRPGTQVIKYTTYNQRHCRPWYICEIWHDMSHMIGRLRLYDLPWTWQIDFVQVSFAYFEDRGLEKQNEMLTRGNQRTSKSFKQLPLAAFPACCEKHPTLQSGRHRSTSFDEESKKLCECSILRSFMVTGWNICCSKKHGSMAGHFRCSEHTFFCCCYVHL